MYRPIKKKTILLKIEMKIYYKMKIPCKKNVLNHTRPNDVDQQNVYAIT